MSSSEEDDSSFDNSDRISEARRGSLQDKITSIPPVIVRETSASDEECPCCFESWASTKYRVVTPCGHMFCNKCMLSICNMRWPSTEGTCAMCRAKIHVSDLKRVTENEQVLDPPEVNRSYSSIWNDAPAGADHGSSSFSTGRGWSAKRNDDAQWMIIDAGSVVDCIKGLVLRNKKEWGLEEIVTKVAIDLGSTKDEWNCVGEFETWLKSGKEDTSVIHFASPRQGRYIRIRILQWQVHISLRCALLVAETVPIDEMHDAYQVDQVERFKQELGLQEHEDLLDPPEANRSYSSVWDNEAVGTGHGRSAWASPQGWSAKRNVAGQWMIIDSGSVVHCIKGLALGNRIDRCFTQVVTKVAIDLASNEDDWNCVGEFQTGFERKEEYQWKVIHFSGLQQARFVRVRPLLWEDHISLRCALVVSDERAYKCLPGRAPGKRLFEEAVTGASH